MWIRPIFLSEPARVWQNSDLARQRFKYIVQTHRSPTESMSQLFILMTRFFMNILQTVLQTYSCWLWTNITEEVRRYEHIYNPPLNTYKDVQMPANSCGEYIPFADFTCTTIGAYLSNAVKDTALIYSHSILNILFRSKVCFDIPWYFRW